MKLYEKGTNKAAEFSPEEAAAAFNSGKWGPKRSQVVQMLGPDGQMRDVKGAEFAQAIDAGGQVASPEQVRTSDLERKFGKPGESLRGTANAVMAQNLAAVRGLPGIGAVSDTVLPKAGALVSSILPTEARQRLREMHGVGSEAETQQAISELRDLYPKSSLVSEIGGTVAGSLALPGPGKLVTSGVEGLTGGAATNLAGKVAQKAAASGITGALEGAVFGAQSEATEQALGDHDLTAEKLLAAAGHGALFGGLTGAGLEVAGGAAKAVTSRLPGLKGASESYAVTALGSRKKFVEDMEKIPGGLKGVGRELQDAGVLGFGDTVEHIAPKVTRARDEAADGINRIVSTVDRGEGVRLAEVTERLEERAKAFDRELGFESAAAQVRGLRDRLVEMYSPASAIVPEVESVIARKARPGPKAPRMPLAPTAEDIEARLGGKKAAERLGPEEFARRVEKELADARAFHTEDVGKLDAAHRKAMLEHARGELSSRVAAPAPVVPKDVRVQLSDLLKQRRTFEGTIDWRSDKVIAQGKQAAGRTIEDAVMAHGDEVATKAGGSFRKEYEAAKLKYRRLAAADDAVTDAVTRMGPEGANRKLSLTDYLSGTAFVGAGVASDDDHLEGAAKGAAAAYAHRLIRTRGNASMAVLLEKAASIGGIRRVAQKVDQDIEHGVDRFFAKPTATPRERVRLRVRDEELAPPVGAEHSRYENRVTQLTAAANEPHRAETAIVPLLGHAPKTAASLGDTVRRATTFLAAKVPRGHADPQSIQPQFERPKVSDVERAKFMRYADAVDNPESVIAGMVKGSVTKEGVEALKAVYPKLYGDIRARVAEKLASSREPLSYQKKIQIAILMDLPADRTMSPAFAHAIADSYRGAQGQQQAPAPNGPPASQMPDLTQSYQTPSQALLTGK